MEKGARLITGCRVENLLIKDGAVTEVHARKGLTAASFQADLVVLAAGGFGTPVILENSGIACDRTLFVDPVLCVAGIKKNFGQDKQLLMPFFSARDGYMLSPYMDYLSFFFNKDWRYPMKDIVSVMIKLADESGGYTDAKGIHKGLTQPDEALLLRAVEDCYAVLEGLGISRKDAFLGTVNAGHPGGCLPLTRETAATLHDSRLPDNLYVADGSLLPKSLGMPPILTIMALALKVATKIEEA